MAAAVDRGEKVCGQDCGGPKRGKVFPRYRGPLTPGVVATRCFVCGTDAQDHASDGSLSRILGVCDRHFHFLKPGGLEGARPEDRGIVVTRKVEVPPEELFGLGGKKED